MAHTNSQFQTAWSPTYFLASLGAGGLAVTFFMYLMFWVPHPDQPVPIFSDVTKALTTGSFEMMIAVGAALVGIAIFGVMNITMLLRNFSALGRFKKTEAYGTLHSTNAQTQMMAMPLAMAMTINVGFILGLVFVPGLWSVVEYLFPLALIAFLAVGVIALRQLGAFIARVTASGGFDCASNNSFSQVLPAFTLSMVGVGLAAPAAMSVTQLTAGIAIVLSTFFFVSAVIIALVGVILGMRSIFENGVAVEQSPTLLIIVPLTTVLSILLLRQDHGLHMHFESHTSAGDTLLMLTRLMSVEVLFLLFGLTVISATGYARRFVMGSEKSAGSYALICPGVAFSVLTHFWINKGLAASGIIEKFGTAYWSLTAIAIASQFAMIVLLVVLNKRHFSAPSNPVRLAA